MTLARIAWIVGAVLAVLSIPLLAAAPACRKWLPRFPRSPLAGRILAAADLIWVVTVMLHASLGRFEVVKPWLYVAGPAAYVAIILLMDELLAGRALGGLLLLLANPVLNAARWHDSDLRLVMTSFVYVWVVAGCILVLSPYRCRDAIAWLTAGDARCRAAGAAGLLLGAVFVALGMRVY
jgi:hypothetical protein